MLALDAVCEKLAEEAAEVSLECALLIKAASKTFRFGPESFSQRNPEEGSNVERVYRAFDLMTEEYRDVKTLMLLFRSMVQPSPVTLQQIASLLPTREERSHAKRHLCKTRRYVAVLVEKGSMTQAELTRLQCLIDSLVQVIADIDPEVH